MNSNLNMLSEKIQTLSADQTDEVEDLVEFLPLKGEELQWVRSTALISTPAFQSVWMNDEDEAYDSL